MKTLFLFTIGPVQSFIGQARKTKDLYAGSFILSYLMKQVVDEATKKGFKIIFPAQGYGSMPNRLLAEIEEENSQVLKQMGIHLEQFVKDQLNALGQSIFQNLKLPPSLFFEEEISNHLEVYWVYEPYKDYLRGYQAINEKLAQIKHLKRSGQQKEKQGRCCSLDPNVLGIFTAKEKMTKSYPSMICLKGEPYQYQLKEQEVLGAMAFVKRFLNFSEAQKEPSLNNAFPSIHEVSLPKEVKQMLLDKPVIQTDGEDVFTTFYNVYQGNAQQVNPAIRPYYEEVIRKAKEREITITPYYAVIKFDGDNMGKKYSVLGKGYESKARELHQVLSEGLLKYAEDVRAIIREYEGVVVYAGGEDFLGILPLRSVFKALKTLRERFNQIQLEAYGIRERVFTFSAGVAIAHVKHPLEDVLRKVEEAEQYAKGIDDSKNAFTFAVIKHSGEVLMARKKFGVSCKQLEQVREGVESIQGKTLPTSFTYKLTQFIKELYRGQKGQEEEDLLINEHIIDLEIGRLLAKTTMSDEERRRAQRGFAQLFASMQGDVEQFSEWLRIILFLAREGV